MRETRPSGSEGGVGSHPHPYLYLCVQTLARIGDGGIGPDDKRYPAIQCGSWVG